MKITVGIAIWLTGAFATLVFIAGLLYHKWEQKKKKRDSETYPGEQKTRAKTNFIHGK